MTDARPGVAAPVATKRRLHTRYVVVAVLCVGIAVWMLTVLQKNVVYLRPVSYAVAHRAQLGTRTFRMGGTVVTGSIDKTSDGARFVAVEGGATADVEYQGGPRDLFRDCAPVVVEGHWAGTVFKASRLLIRHGSAYDPNQRVSAGCKAGSSQ